MFIISSLLDTDFYTFTQGQAIYHNYPDVWVKYKFKCRNGSAIPTTISSRAFINEIKREVDHLCELSINNAELSYIFQLGFFKRSYIEFLNILKLSKHYISIDAEGDELIITIEGPWCITVFFEVPVLAIVSELYHRYVNPKAEIDALNILKQKILEAKELLDLSGVCSDDFRFADFGTRRRYSFELHFQILESCIRCMPNNFMGTSNVHFAMITGIKPIGTMSHQWIMAHQQLVKLIDHQKTALDVWAREYRGDLGIALSDTVGFDAFLQDFDLYFSKLFDGCRHDSGDPSNWGEKLINHYLNFNIDPMTKDAVFSDGLTLEKSVSLFLSFYSKIRTSFGIGTNLTNDTGVNALQIVIKMVECNGRPVAKISDSSGKGMCESEMFEQYVRKTFGV